MGTPELGRYASSLPNPQDVDRSSGLLRSQAGSLDPAEREELWRFFAAIGELWETAKDGSASMRSRWSEFVETRCRQEPSYLAEYRSALRVLEELMDAHGRPRTYRTVYLESGEIPDEPANRFERMRKFVAGELIQVHLVAGGFKAFGAKNTLGYVGGSRYRRLPAYHAYGEQRDG